MLDPDRRVARQLALLWGTYPRVTGEAERVSDIVGMVCEAAASEGVAGPGDIIAIAAGTPFGVAGSTNLLRIEQLPAERENPAASRRPPVP